MTPGDVTLDGLDAFAVFASHLNFTRAAEELHLSQPALHVKVRRLGEALGVSLYVRDGRQLTLTAAGKSVAEFAMSMHTELSGFMENLTSVEEVKPLVLAAGEGAHLHVMADAVRRMLSRGDDIRLLTTNTDATIDAVTIGKADLGVAVLSARPRGISATPIATYPQVAALPIGHPLASHRTIHLADLTDASLVVPASDRPHRRNLERAMKRAGVPWSVALETEGWAQMLQFVSLGVGLAIVNGCVRPGRDIVTRPIPDLPSVTYSALHRTEAAGETRVTDVVALLQASAP
jgi:DNA-binding transcriptional LysR family regulator